MTMWCVIYARRASERIDVASTGVRRPRVFGPGPSDRVSGSAHTLRN